MPWMPLECSKHHTMIKKILTFSLTLIIGLGIFANGSSALIDCSAACCIGSRASLTPHHTPRITVTTPCCRCSNTAAFPCEVTGGQKKQPSPPALLKAHQHDHRDLTVAWMDAVGTPTGSPRKTDASTLLFSASILKVPIYLTTQTFLC